MPRTVWTRKTDIPDDGGSQSGWLSWGCGSLSDYSGCSWTFSFRGTGSSDPDADIASWSLDFGDGTSVSGSWGTAPPTEVEHEYSRDQAYLGRVVLTLTVTDSAGQSDSDVIVMVFIDQSPD
jgi:PKD domain